MLGRSFHAYHVEWILTVCIVSFGAKVRAGQCLYANGQISIGRISL